jgi:hypothetical protein
MKKFLSVIVCGLIALGLAGCCGVSAPYIMQTDRVDQDVASGNKGYLKGTPPPSDDRSNLKRPLIAVDIDLPDTPINLESGKKKEECVK